MILAAGDVVYGFDIAKIRSSAVATSYEKTWFFPFHEFFADHTVVCHDSVSNCASLLRLELQPASILETRLLVRMILLKTGIQADDSFKASVLRFLGVDLNRYHAKEHQIAQTIPLLHALRSELQPDLADFESYCGMLPSLAHAQAHGLPFQDEIPYYELNGRGEILMTPDLSLLSEEEKQSLPYTRGTALLTVRFSSKPNLCALLPALRDANLFPLVILDDEMLFQADNQIPEKTALLFMQTVAPIVGLT